MGRRIEAVIFDWAGTTVDFGCMAPVQAFVSAFQKYGITPTLDEVREPMGMLKRDHIRTMMNMERIHEEWKRVHGRDFTEEDVEEVYRTSERSLLDTVREFTDPKPYVLETVKALGDRRAGGGEEGLQPGLLVLPECRGKFRAALSIYDFREPEEAGSGLCGGGRQDWRYGV